MGLCGFPSWNCRDIFTKTQKFELMGRSRERKMRADAWTVVSEGSEENGA